MVSSNPIFRRAGSEGQPAARRGADLGEHATLGGVALKACGLLVVVVAAALLSRAGLASVVHPGPNWGLFVTFLAVSAGAAGLIFLTAWKKRWSKPIALVYAPVQGLVMGVVAAGLDMRYPGAAMQVVLVTVAMFSGLLLAYRSGLIRVADGYNRKIAAAAGGGLIFYALNFSLGLAGARSMRILAPGVPALVGVGLASVFAVRALVADFDAAGRIARTRLPAYMEWYVAFGLIVTLVWLYADIAYLVSRARSAQSVGRPPVPG